MTLGQALQRSAVLPLDARAPSLPRCEHEALEEADRSWRAALLRRLGGPPGRPSSQEVGRRLSRSRTLRCPTALPGAQPLSGACLEPAHGAGRLGGLARRHRCTAAARACPGVTISSAARAGRGAASPGSARRWLPRACMRLSWPHSRARLAICSAGMAPVGYAAGGSRARRWHACSAGAAVRVGSARCGGRAARRRLPAGRRGGDARAGRRKRPVHRGAGRRRAGDPLPGAARGAGGRRAPDRAPRLALVQAHMAEAGKAALAASVAVAADLIAAAAAVARRRPSERADGARIAVVRPGAAAAAGATAAGGAARARGRICVLRAGAGGPAPAAEPAPATLPRSAAPFATRRGAICPVGGTRGTLARPAASIVGRLRKAAVQAEHAVLPRAALAAADIPRDGIPLWPLGRKRATRASGGCRGVWVRGPGVREGEGRVGVLPVAAQDRLVGRDVGALVEGLQAPRLQTVVSVHAGFGAPSLSSKQDEPSKRKRQVARL